MALEIFSNQIGSASELLLATNVKQGFIPYRNTMTYASRLRTFLKLVSEPRAKSLVGNERGIFVTPIDRLRTLHMVRWTLFDNDSRLLLAVTFDRPIGPYIRQIVDEGGPLLDTILCHADDYESSSTDLGYKCFLRYAQTHQIEADLFTASFPQLTSDDYNFLIGAQQIQNDFSDVSTQTSTNLTELVAHRWDAAETDLNLAKYRLETPGAKAHRMLISKGTKELYQRQALRLLRTVHYVSRFFPDPDPANPEAGPPLSSKDHIFYRDFAKFLVEQVDFTKIDEEDRKAFKAPLAWLSNGPTHRQKVPVHPPQKHLSSPRNVQGDIITSYKDTDEKQTKLPMNAGALLLLRFKDSASGAAFLRQISTKIATEVSSTGPIRVNLALTYQGLKTLNVPEQERLGFPADFREGLAGRAGMLGDVGTNSPELWDPRRHDENGEDLGALDLETVDAVLQLQRRVDDPSQEHIRNWNEHHPLKKDADQMLQPGVRLLTVETMTRHANADGKFIEHFGFVDGISNPKVLDDPSDPDYVPLGAMILGYDDDESEDLPAVQRDGSFMVIRKMSQNVEKFKDLSTDVQSKMMGRTKDGHPLVGYKPNLTPEQEKRQNFFDYANDPHGLACPFAAHTRRVNPRDKLGKNETTGEITHGDTPRIMRRGFTYGPPPGTESYDTDRGIMFVCYNASIGEQYEVIQRWIGGGNATGIYSGDSDPIMGPGPTTGSRKFRYVADDGKTVSRVDLPRESYVRLLWGLYAFVPSISAINMIASWAETRTVTGTKDEISLAKHGAKIIRELNTIDDWKRALEDSDERNRERGDAIMAYINRDHDGVYKAWYTPDGNGNSTDYFVIVASPDKVVEVFRDTEKFSNRAYWPRMKDAMGEVYLGMDPEPQPLFEITKDPLDQQFEESTKGVYGSTSKDVNPFLWLRSASDLQNCFDKVVNGLTEALEEVPSEVDPTVGTNDLTRRKLIDVEELIGVAIADITSSWLGLPVKGLRDGPDEPAMLHEIMTMFPHVIDENTPAPQGTPKSPNDFQDMAAYFFGPWPRPHTKARAEFVGQRLISRLTKWLNRRDNEKEPNLDPDTLIGHLQALTKEGSETGRKYDNKKIIELVLNAGVGLSAASCASFANICYDWVKEGTLWRHQQELLDTASAKRLPPKSYEVANSVLRDHVIDTMSKFASPDLLHRTCAQEGVIIGGVDIDPGKQIVLALGPAAERCPHANRLAKEEILFGGLYGGTQDERSNTPIHACPGREAALTIIMAAMTVLMNSGEIVRNSSLTLFVPSPPNEDGNVAPKAS